MDYEDEYDEFDYDDAAEDWEAEAEQEERDAQAKEAARAARKEEKLSTRAPVHAAPVVEEAAVELTLQQAIDKLHSSAADVASAAELMSTIDGPATATTSDGDRSTMSSTKLLSQLLATRQFDSAADATAFGALLASHLAVNRSKRNYGVMLGKLFELLAGEMKDTTALNRLMAKVHIGQEELKRKAKDSKSHKAAAATIVSHDALGFDAIEDKLGAARPASDDGDDAVDGDAERTVGAARRGDGANGMHEDDDASDSSQIM